jgi:hypothetical protein
VLRTDVVECTALRMFHMNPRIGNVEKIAESLKENGQFKPIVVNIGTHTGRANEILAGNHTWLGTKRNGNTHILASFVDVDEETATRINIADNKTADDGEYDDTILRDLLATLPTAVGTGFDQSEMDDLLKDITPDIDASIDSINESIDESRNIEEEVRRKETFDGSDLGDEPEPDREPPARPGEEQRKPQGPTIEGQSEDLKGGFTLKEDMEIAPEDRVGQWGIPRLREDLLMTFDDIPDNLIAWAGSATKDWDDPDQWWLYNWGIDSTSGMKDVSKVVCSFYCWDDYFENWWHFPHRYTTKLLNSKIRFALTPNWSQWPTVSGVANLWNLYRARWIGRYLQEAGIKVCPDINWPMGDRKFLKEQVLDTLPKDIPLISIQVQTFNEDEVKEAGDNQIEDFQLIFDTLRPKGLLLYSGKPGKEWFEKNIKPNCPVFFVETRMAKLAEAAKGRERKKTI